MAAMFRIVKLDGAVRNRYKVQQFKPERNVFWWFKTEAGWKDVAYKEYNGKNYIHDTLVSAEMHLKQLQDQVKDDEAAEKDDWVAIQGDIQ